MKAVKFGSLFDRIKKIRSLIRIYKVITTFIARIQTFGRLTIYFY